jgi:membrane associated rhomboid family serine protease
LSENLTNIKNHVNGDGAKIFDAIIASIFFLSIAWALFLMDEYLGYNLGKYGLIPRDFIGLRGIFTMHFLHGGLNHIWHNTLAFIVLNTFLFYFYRSISIKTFFTIFFFSGIMLWIIGRPTVHIGASMIIYGEFAFLFLSGIIRKNPILARVTLIVGLYYGSLVWYLFPVDAKISWEGHLSGFVIGLIAAIIFRKQGPQRKVYRYEVEPELSDENPYWLESEKMGPSTGSGTRESGEVGPSTGSGTGGNEEVGPSTGSGTGGNEEVGPSIHLSKGETLGVRSIVYHCTPKKKDQQ